MIDLERFLASPEVAAASSHEERCRLVAEHLAAHNGRYDRPVAVAHQERSLQDVPQHSLRGLTRQQRGQWYVESNHGDAISLIGWTSAGAAFCKLTCSRGEREEVSFRRITRDGRSQLADSTPVRDGVVFRVTPDDGAEADPHD